MLKTFARWFAATLIAVALVAIVAETPDALVDAKRRGVLAANLLALVLAAVMGVGGITWLLRGFREGALTDTEKGLLRPVLLACCVGGGAVVAFLGAHTLGLSPAVSVCVGAGILVAGIVLVYRVSRPSIRLFFER